LVEEVTEGTTMRSLTDSQWERVREVATRLRGAPAAERMAMVESLRASGENPNVLSLAALQARMPPEDANRTDQKIGNFTLKERISTGGMGVVYLAEQDMPRREVVVKLIHPALTASPGMEKRFLEEIESLGRLEHIGIARIYAGGIHTERSEQGGASFPYYAMEYVRGTPITTYHQEQCLPLRELLELFLQVCAAVHYVHEMRVIHRDLKPEHILVDGRGIARVLDFGLAQLFDPSLPRRTREFLSGTPAYMSPEQVSDEHGEVGPWSDVYALGLILYEALAGRRPYEVWGGSPEEIRKVILETEPARLGTVNGGYCGELEEIVARAIANHPHKRYQSAAVFADALRRYLKEAEVRKLLSDLAAERASTAELDQGEDGRASLGRRLDLLRDFPQLPPLT
jgi:non-specific serine/threonine protein kinase/serine/threonine-protein kinase